MANAASTSSAPSSSAVPSTLTALLHEFAYEDVAKTLVQELDCARNPQAADWCAELGAGAGHALPLYYDVRNTLKWRAAGVVPSTRTLFLGLTHAVLLLVRVAQDVAVCRLDLARRREFVYLALRAKLWSWVRLWRDVTLPRVADVVAAVDAWFQAVSEPLPLPVWAVAFDAWWPTHTTFTWGTPSAEDVAAFQRNSNIAHTRARVRDNALAALRAMHTWEAVFALPGTIMQ